MRLLTGALIDQIAAGEVVERPVSVVKELVENALDADSSRIRVEIRRGGQDFISVTDDGIGMSPQDTRLALERHATSKIASVADLSRIRTYGFRGEALPAIASVSRTRIRSRLRGAAEACEIQVEVGKVTRERRLGGPEGTRVEVADLFLGVPARRKFLKSVTTEWGHISDWLARAALAIPGVHFDIQRDDRPATVWPAVSDPLERVAAVVSEADAAAFTQVSRAEGRASIEGFVSRPERHRASAAGIYLFVNRRPVRDRVLQHALVEVFRDLLPRGRFPAAVLFLSVPPELVDVNVHPAKWEVRFSEPQAIHALVRHAVRESVSARRWLHVDPVPPEAVSVTSDGWTGPVGHGAPSSTQRPKGGTASVTDWVFADARTPARGGAPIEAESQLEWTASDGRIRFGDLPLLGQLMATYLVCETKSQLLLIDQHAAHERVLYERLRAEWLERGVESQGLLVPETLRLEPRPLAALIESGDAVDRLGFDWEDFGDGTIAVRAVPALLADRDPAQLVRNLAEELAAAGAAADALRPGSRSVEASDQVFASLACHSARRKGEVLDPREQRALIDALDAIPWAPSCPHGRPVSIPIELTEIERRFGRR
ncbi:MAG: DNA mismatch repair endonuclease MutL [Myxococcota bacterium]